jgi:DNA ligase 1
MGVMVLGVPPQAKAKVYTAKVSHETDDFAYLTAPIGVRVKYRNLTKTGLLRLPSFVEFVD